MDDEAEELCNKIVNELDWQGETFTISAFQKKNTDDLCQKVMDFIATLPAEIEEAESEEEVSFKWDTYHRNTIEQQMLDEDDDDDFDDDDYDVEVVYTRE